jgi:hypothetical protein
MTKWIFASFLVLGVVALLTVGVFAAPLNPTQIVGRWSGNSRDLMTGGALTLDIIACGSGWCGIKVEAEDKCGGTALKLESVQPLGGNLQSDSLQFNGSLQLAAGSEPYVVQAWLLTRPDNGSLILQIMGDTGGEFRAYRRTFPFETALSRISEAECKAPQPVSSLR